jgi:hypothetical protein
VWAGLSTQIIKIARRGVQPPRFHPLLQSLHVGRFAGWAWTGAAAIPVDPITAGLLISTRLPAVALVAMTFLQRSTPRPAPARVAAAVLGSLAFVGGVGFAVYAVIEQFPGYSEPIEKALTAFVLTCFATQLLWALPQQILAARHQPLGNLRWFQMALASSYGMTFLYAFAVQAEWIQWIMIGVYGLAFVEQVLLVYFIERGVRAMRLAAAQS